MLVIIIIILTFDLIYFLFPLTRVIPLNIIFLLKQKMENLHEN